MNERIAFFSAKPYDAASFDRANRDFGFDIRYLETPLNAESAVLARGAPAVCAFVNDSVGADVLGRLAESGVGLVALRSAGFNNVDLGAADGLVKIARVPAYSPHAVAEHTLALMLTLNRKTHKAYSRTRDGNFALHGLMGFDMNGKTAGIIGTGKIAKILAATLRAMGMEILAYDIFPDKKFAERHGVKYVALDELYAKSDIISLHCPLTKDTLHMIDAAAISKMKDGVMIINTSRGKLIDTRALIGGLKGKKIGSAGLDVYEEEGAYFYEDLSDRVMDDDTLARLLSFSNVVVTSHQAFFTREALDNIAQTTLQNVRDFLDKKPLANEVRAPDAAHGKADS